jgi:opacity protein-like surface antigen
MKRFFYITCLVLTVSLSALAQEKAEEIPRVEVFGGYAYGGPSQGWNGALAGNVNKWFAIVADVGGQTSNVTEVDFQERIKSRTYLFGPQVSFRHKRFTPFVRVLAGVATVKTNAIESGQTFSFADTEFVWAAGGGLDIRVTRRVAIRAFQLDYLRTKFFGESQHNGRLSVGLVFRFGKQ